MKIKLTFYGAGRGVGNPLASKLFCQISSQQNSICLQRSRILRLRPWNLSSATSAWFVAALFGCKKNAVSPRPWKPPGQTFLQINVLGVSTHYARVQKNDEESIWQITKVWTIYTWDDRRRLKSSIYCPPGSLSVLVFSLPSAASCVSSLPRGRRRAAGSYYAVSKSQSNSDLQLAGAAGSARAS